MATSYSSLMLGEIAYLKNYVSSALSAHLPDDTVVSEYQNLQHIHLTGGSIHEAKLDWADKGYPGHLFHGMLALHELTVLEAGLLSGKKLDAATLAYRFGGAVTNAAACGNIPMMEHADRFNRKGKTQTKTRSKQSITLAIEYLIDEMAEQGIDPDVDDMMKLCRKLTADTKGQNQKLSAWVAKVVLGQAGYIKMQEGCGKHKDGEEDDRIYTRKELHDRLTSLMKKK